MPSLAKKQSGSKYRKNIAVNNGRIDVVAASMCDSSCHGRGQQSASTDKQSPLYERERERCNIKRSWKNNSGKSWNIATAASHRTVQTPSEVPWRVSWVTLWDASQCICFSEIIMLWEATIHKLSNWAASPCCPMRKSSHSQSMYDRWARACGKGSWTGFPNRRCQRGLQSNANTRCPRGLTSQKWSNMAPKCEPTVPPRLWHPAKRANLVFSNAQFSSSVPSWCPFYHGLHGKHSFSTCLEPLPAECRRGSIVASMPGGHKAARST